MTGWAIGYFIGLAVVGVVVLLVLMLIVSAKRTAVTAEAILEALIDARDNTAGLWQVQGTNATALRIVEAASNAREAFAKRGATQ